MTLKEKIIETINQRGPLTDRELTNIILGETSAQQSVNQACRALAVQGFIVRKGSPITNALSNAQGLPNASSLPPSPKLSEQSHHTNDFNLHEEAIKQFLNEYLMSNNWVTKVAWGKTHGIDIYATKDNQKWIIEVKGCGSLNPMRVNYFLSIIGETLQRMDDANARYSIALPNIQQYRNLWDRLPQLAKERTTIDAIFVDSDGKITECK